MAVYYVKNTGTNVGGTTWATAFTTLKAAMEAAAPGDTIYVSHLHTETSASPITINATGTAAAPLKVICGTDTQQPPTTPAATAQVTTTGASPITITGSVYVYGIVFSSGSGSSLAGIRFGDSVVGSSHSQVYENCKFRLGTTSTGTRINSGVAGPVTLKSCWFRFGSSSQKIVNELSTLTIDGGGVESGGVAITSGVFQCGTTARPANIFVSGFSMANIGANTNLVVPQFSGKVILRNVLLPGGLAQGLNPTGKYAGFRAEMHNFNPPSATDVNYKIWVEDYYGSLNDETTIVRTGGASDGVTPISWKIVTAAEASYPAGAFETPEIVAWNSLNAQRTVSVEIVHDSLTPLKDDEIWLEVQYLGTDGSPLALFANDGPASILAAGTNQPASTVTWTTTGMSSPNKQRLSVTALPYERGFFVAKVKVAKPNTTVYVDPKLVIS